MSVEKERGAILSRHQQSRLILKSWGKTKTEDKKGKSPGYLD